MAVRAAVEGSVQRGQETADDGSDGYNKDYDTTDEEGDGDDQTEDDGDDGDDGDDSDSGDEGLSERDGEPDDVGDQGDDQDSDTGAIEDDGGGDQSDDSDDGQWGVEQDADQEGDMHRIKSSLETQEDGRVAWRPRHARYCYIILYHTTMHWNSHEQSSACTCHCPYRKRFK